MDRTDEGRHVPTPGQRQGRKSPAAIIVLLVGGVVALVLCLAGLFFLAIWWSFRVPEAGAEVDAATSENLYQPVIADAELVDESKKGASRSLEDSTPTRVERTYITVGTVVEAAEAYRAAADADGWQLRRSECSAQDFRSTLTFVDPTNEDRGGTRIRFRPVFEDRKITDQVEIIVLIEVSGRFDSGPATDESHSCLDDHVVTLRANPPLRSIGADEMLEIIKPELLIASGVGNSTNGHKFGEESVWFNRVDGERLIDVDNAEPHQIAALWDRRPDEAFPFSDDRFDYWFIPFDGGALIVRQAERVPDEAMLELAEALRTG